MDGQHPPSSAGCSGGAGAGSVAWLARAPGAAGGGGSAPRLACNQVLHRVLWDRLVVDDAHQLLNAPPGLLVPWDRRKDGGAAGAAGSAVVVGTATVAAKAQAVALVRAESRWCLLTAARAQRLWRSREQLRNLLQAIGTPHGASLIKLVPEFVLEME